MASNDVDNYDLDLENRILRCIWKIKRKRKRPCYQSIREKLLRGGRDIGMEDLKIFLEHLLEKGLISRKMTGKGGNETESFALCLHFEASDASDSDEEVIRGQQK